MLSVWPSITTCLTSGCSDSSRATSSSSCLERSSSWAELVSNCTVSDRSIFSPTSVALGGGGAGSGSGALTGSGGGGGGGSLIATWGAGAPAQRITGADQLVSGKHAAL